MTHLPPSRRRRILSLPAVYPCEAVPPAILLRSLISLSREISARRLNFFPAHRRCVREAAREAGLLLAFLEDVADRGCHLPQSAVAALSELHVSLQKLRLLLVDCSRRGGRLWVLVRGDWIRSGFRVLFRSVAVALDVLPLDDVGASPEAKEWVCLLAAQAWRTAVAVPEEDEDLAVRSVRSILEQFRNGVAPDSGDLKRVLDLLRVQTWFDCDEEIAFLEEETFELMEAGEGEGEEAEQLALLGTLMEFMVYCRAVMFNLFDGKRGDQKELEGPAIVPIAAADCLQCPISLELMTDPVTVSTGQTYDRASIKRWIKAGRRTCPVTGEKLANAEFVPNSAIRKLAEQFCCQNNINVFDASANHRRAVDKTAVPFSPAAAGAVRLAVDCLVGKVANGTVGEKKKATYEMRKLSKSNVFHRVCLVEADAVSWLLYLLPSSDPWTQDNAVATLLNMSKHPSGQKAIFDAGGLGPIVDVIMAGLKAEARQNAAAILFYLSPVEEYRIEIGAIPCAIPRLVELLRDGAYRGKKNAAVTLYGLLQYPGNHPKVLSAGAVPVLVDLLFSDREDLVADSIAVLEKIAGCHAGTAAILQSSPAPRLVEVLSSSASRSGKEHCISLLLSLADNGGDAVITMLGQMPALMTSLYDQLVTEGSARASKNARSLLNHIHRCYDRHGPPGPPHPAPIGDRTVPAQ